jgi:hypothetical protein
MSTFGRDLVHDVDAEKKTRALTVAWWGRDGQRGGRLVTWMCPKCDQSNSFNEVGDCGRRRPNHCGWKNSEIQYRMWDGKAFSKELYGNGNQAPPNVGQMYKLDPSTKALIVDTSNPFAPQQALGLIRENRVNGHTFMTIASTKGKENDPTMSNTQGSKENNAKSTGGSTGTCPAGDRTYSLLCYQDQRHLIVQPPSLPPLLSLPTLVSTPLPLCPSLCHSGGSDQQGRGGVLSAGGGSSGGAKAGDRTYSLLCYQDQRLLIVQPPSLP